MNYSVSDITTNITLENPYVGPEAFSRDKHDFFRGRERETYELAALLAARRLVLFYAQSGAGKTSLINAGLAPLLEKERGFEVLPMARPSGAKPQGIMPITNIFVYNMMVNIDKSRRAEQCCADLHLTDFLLDLGQQDGQYFYLGDDEITLNSESVGVAVGQPDSIRRRALIIDQFEEIFTAHPGEYEARADFFAQLAQAMEDDPYLYILLSMRADYVHHLTRYVHLLPDGLRSRYYMPRMHHEAALEAVKEPAENAGRPFAPGVAEELVKHLRRERNHDPTGREEAWTYGETVEPVQLQVVCYQLWQSLADSEKKSITLDDLIHVARDALTQEKEVTDPLATFVDSALGTYYEQSLAIALDTVDTDVTEEYLRDWFSHKLITKAGTRGFLLRGAAETDGLPEEMVKALEKRRLLRSETRAGGRWSELVHDSFIIPVREANEIWMQQRMRQTPWIAAAYHWAQEVAEIGEERANGLLLSDEFLQTAFEEAGDLNRQPEIVRNFLQNSKRVEVEKQAEAERERAEVERRQAEAERKQAEADRKRAEAERKRVEVEKQRAEAERRRAEEKKRAEEAEAHNKQLTRQKIGLTVFGAIAAVASVIAVFLFLQANTIYNELNTIYGELTNNHIELEKAADKLEIANTDLETKKSELELVNTTLLSKTTQLEESQKQLIAATLEREAQEFLDRGESISAMLFSLAVSKAVPERIPYDILSRALDESYTTQNIEGPFRQETMAPFPAVHLFTGIEPQTIIISSSTQIQTWNPTRDRTKAFTQAEGSLLAISADGKTVATAVRDKDRITIVVSDYPSDTTKMTIPVETQSSVEAAAFDQTGSWLAIAQCDTDTHEVDEQRVCKLSVNPLDTRDATTVTIQDSITDIAFADAATVVWANEKGNLFAWRWEESPDQRALTTLREHRTQALLQSGDAGSFFTAGCLQDESYRCEKGFIQRWIFDSNDEFVREGVLNAPQPIVSLAMTQGMSQVIALFDYDNMALVWESDIETWPTFACDVAQRNLTYDEWDGAVKDADIDRDISKACEGFGDVNGLDISFAVQAVKACDMDEARAFAAEASPEDASAFLSEIALEVTIEQLINRTNASDDACMLQQAVDLIGDDAPASGDIETVLDTVSTWSSRPVTQVNEIQTVERMIIDWPTIARRILSPQVIKQYETLCRSTPSDQRACGLLASTLSNADFDSISYGQTIAGKKDTRWWQFGGEAGEFISIAMDKIDAGVDAYLELLDATGTVLKFDDDGGRDQNSRLIFPLPEHGQYYIRAINRGAPGRYEVTLNRLELTTLKDGRTMTATTEAQSLWQFKGQQAGEFISLAMDGIDPGVDAYLELWNANGAVLAFDDDSGGDWNSRLTHPLPTDGRYYVRATSIGGPGRYELTLNRLEVAPLNENQAITTTTDAHSLWRFDGRAGEYIYIAMDGIDEGVDAYLKLLDANGDILQFDDDGGGSLNSRLVYPLPADDRYYVQTTSIGQPGLYQLMLTRHTTTTIGFGDIKFGTTIEQPVWIFDGERGDVMSIELTGANLAFDPQLTLFDASGVVLSGNDDSGEGYMGYDARMPPLALPASGRYAISVGRGGSSEPYTLSLRTITETVQVYVDKLRQDSAYRLESVNEANRMCWLGALEGFAADVLPACENAVALDTNNYRIRDSRGLAQALAGNITEAIDDFEFALAGARAEGRSDGFLETRTAWVKALAEGQDPAEVFDEATREALKHE